MTTVTKRPGYTEGGWTNPENLFEDGKYCVGVDKTWQKLTEYGFSIPSDATITKVVVKVKGYETSPENDYTYFDVWDGTEWKGRVIPLESIDQIVEVDITDLISWSPEILNNLETRLHYLYTITVGLQKKSSPYVDYVEVEVTYSTPYPTTQETTQIMMQGLEQFMSMMFTMMFMIMIMSMMTALMGVM